MTVNYQGRRYGHQQIWALVAALGANGIYVRLHGGAISKPACRLTWYDGDPDDESANALQHHVLGAGEPGDRTPFRALARAIAKMETLGARAHAPNCASPGAPNSSPGQLAPLAGRCAWCLQPVTPDAATVTVQNTDTQGTTHRLKWHLGTECTNDPVYRAVCESRRMPGNALMILAARCRELDT